MRFDFDFPIQVDGQAVAHLEDCYAILFADPSDPDEDWKLGQLFIDDCIIPKSHYLWGPMRDYLYSDVATGQIEEQWVAYVRQQHEERAPA